MKQLQSLVFVVLVNVLLFSSCKKDEILTDSSAKLEFSTDTVFFDTVFSSIGSTTRLFKIYNFHNRPLSISRIYLGGGTSSPYHINVDGVSASSHTDVEIAANDSMFIFVQVNIDPSGINSPLLVRDSVIFETNGNVQTVQLIAIGQDVYLHKPDHFPTNGLPPYSVDTSNQTWSNDKPHLIFGYHVVDSAATLTMLPGTKVYMHNNAVLWIYKDGSLVINGSQGSPVTIQGDRLEPEYQDLPGQWGKIWMMKGSKNNSVNWAVIRNGGIGIQADSVFISTSPTVTISNTIIRNFTGAALFGQSAYIRANNSVFANCGQYVAALTLGGKYAFQQCTFGNYWNFTSGSSPSQQRSTPLLIMNNYYVDASNTLHLRDLDSCYFGNCILYGDLAEEIGMDTTTSGGNFAYEFDHCLLRSSRPTPAGSHYNVVLKNLDPMFRDPYADDYRLNPGSPAIDAGDPAINIVLDLLGQNRPNPSTSVPDLGAYEFY